MAVVATTNAADVRPPPNRPFGLVNDSIVIPIERVADVAQQPLGAVESSEGRGAHDIVSLAFPRPPVTDDSPSIADVSDGSDDQ